MMTLKNKIIKIFITFLFFLLPFIDILRTTNIKNIEIFNIAVIELINMILIIIPFIITIYNNYKKNNKLFTHHEYIYIILLIIYLIFHIKNISNFDVSIYDEFIFDWIVEIYYIFRVYMLPLMLIYVLLNNKDIFDKTFYLKLVRYLIIIISGSIVLLNLFRFSYSSYSDPNNQYLINKSCFIDVFNYIENFRSLLTCGLFPSANQISIILVMLLPLNLYNMYISYNYKNIFLVILQVLSMIIVGTKTAALGSIIILISCLLMYMFFAFIYKKYDKKYLIKSILIIFVSIFIIFISPFSHMAKEKSIFVSTIPNNENEKYDEVYDNLEKLQSKEDIRDYIMKYNGVFKIDKVFLDMYPIMNDTEFWLNIARRNSNLNNDYRIIKIDILNRIQERNNNKFDKYLGLGYNLNFMDIERDYVYQYYLFGIFGFILLVGVYILIYLLNLKEVFKKKKFIYENCLILVSGFFGLVLCYFSGHLFGWVSPMLILAFNLCIERRIIYES